MKPKREFDGHEYEDYPGIAKAYAEAVTSGRVLVCMNVRLACKRYLDMLVRAESGEEKFYFSDEDAVDVCAFIEKLPLTKGTKSNFVLAPWQIFCLSATFGFRRDDPDFPATRGTRLVREIYWEIPRGHGKSALLAAIALYCFCCEGEFGSQIFIVGPKEDQARKVFDPILSIIDVCGPLVEQYGLEKTLKLVRKDKSDPSARISLVSSIAEKEDGHDPHVVIAEELHAQDEALIEVMQSSMAKRQQTLFASITTAGRRATGTCWSTRNRLISILKGEHKADNFFGVIYSVDPSDLDNEKVLGDPKTWRKAMPMYGITIDPSAIDEEFERAKTKSNSAMLEFRRTRLNIWTNADGGLVSPDRWADCHVPDLKLKDFKGERAWIGCDLASKNDIAALAIVFEVGDSIASFARYFIPSESRGFKKESTGLRYTGWAKDGFITVTPGGVVVYGEIEAVIREWVEMFDVQGVAFDSYQSNDIVTRLYNDGVPAVTMPTGTKALSDPTKDFLAKVECGAFAHDGNPVTEWMAMNVVGHWDFRENVLPRKEDKNSDNKIDGIHAICFANALRLDALLDEKVKRPSVYNTRGLLGGDGDDDDVARPT